MGPDQATVSAAMAPSLASQLPQVTSQTSLLRLARNLVGAGLASDGGRSGNCVGCNGPIAVSPISPLEVEQVLLKHPAVELAQGSEASVDDLIGFCKERCANFKVPRFLAIVDDFESIGMTGSSKVQKGRLREHALKQFGLG